MAPASTIIICTDTRSGIDEKVGLRRHVLADTFYWIALANVRDAAHGRILGISRGLAFRRIVTTAEVLIEYLNFYSEDPRLRMVAAQTVEDILAGTKVQVLPQSQFTFRSGLDLFRSRPDKGYSLTDCVSMESMRALGIADVLTDDHHFQQEGFGLVR